MISLTSEQMVEVAIRCCLGMDSDRESLAAWRMWAERWLSGEDRTASAAQAAARDVFDHVTGDVSADISRIALDATYAACVFAARDVVSRSLVYFYFISAVNRASSYSKEAEAGVKAIIRQVCGQEVES